MVFRRILQPCRAIGKRYGIAIPKDTFQASPGLHPPSCRKAALLRSLMTAAHSRVFAGVIDRLLLYEFDSPSSETHQCASCRVWQSPFRPWLQPFRQTFAWRALGKSQTKEQIPTEQCLD